MKGLFIVNKFWMMLLIFSVFFVMRCDNGLSEPGPDEIWMHDYAFQPQRLTVHRGDTVKWINREDPLHRVVSGVPGVPDSLFDSGELAYNDTFTYVFDSIGLFNYFCLLHPAMIGSVTVEGGTGR